MKSVWRHDDSKWYHQNFLLCNNNEITTCTADLFNSFCDKVNMLALFKVMQQQVIGEVSSDKFNYVFVGR